MASAKLDSRPLSTASTATATSMSPARAEATAMASSRSASKERHIAFLGATGGCTLAALTHTLLYISTSRGSGSGTNVQVQHQQQHQCNYHCIALARTPSKLRNLLLAQNGITPELLSSKLTIVQGDATDKQAVKRVLSLTSTSGNVRGDAKREKGVDDHHDEYAEAEDADELGADDGETVELVDTIVSGLGAAPKLQWWSIRQPVTLDNPTICQDAAHTLVAALQELLYDVDEKEQEVGPRLGEGGEKKARKKEAMSKKPLLGFISTTGISRGPEDVPFWCRWLYRYVLVIPHEDKRVMESIFSSRGSGLSVGEAMDGDDDDTSDTVFRGVVGVRPSLLTGTGDVRDGLGMARVRVGREKEPAVGYSIKRADVGEWVFNEVVQRHGEGWEGEMVTLTC